ncbi:hypothetical protein FRX31_033952 [Thalictrum thalictroides]|uniref:Uncharacterized protein n=1 Tax=Thalictrum thalictroides TaxID=46969 RepID=A0A7J6UVH0_THATH|nr:hypothetical protein FRX31_033952 [Thalictrum thalictroides]
MQQLLAELNTMAISEKKNTDKTSQVNAFSVCENPMQDLDGDVLLRNPKVKRTRGQQKKKRFKPPYEKKKTKEEKCRIEKKWYCW